MLCRCGNPKAPFVKASKKPSRAPFAADAAAAPNAKRYKDTFYKQLENNALLSGALKYLQSLKLRTLTLFSKSFGIV